MEIRCLTVDDYESMLDVWREAGLSTIRPAGRDSREELARQMTATPWGFQGAFEDGQLAGLVLASHDGRKGWINRLAVRPAYRRQGLAEKLLEAAEQTLRDQGIKVLCALIEDYNSPSMILFAKHGYLRHDDILYFSKRGRAED